MAHPPPPPSARRDELFVGGAWTPGTGRERFPVISPTSEELLHEQPLATAADADAALDAARRSFVSGVWAERPAGERATALWRVAALLERRAPELVELMGLELGQRPTAACWRVSAAVDVWRFAANLAPRALMPEPSFTSDGRPASVHRVPMGVAFLITPWNSPLLLASMKASAALAAGCSGVLKPAPEAPLTLNVLAEVLQEAGLPDGVVSVLPAGAEITARIVADDRVDIVSFTGSTEVGAKIAASCAARIGRVALELGGKSPAVVLPGSDTATVVPQLLEAAGLSTAGQVCTARTRILVPHCEYERWAEVLASAMRAMRVGPPDDPRAEVGPLATARQRDRVLEYIAVGRSEGARLLCGGERPAHLERGFFVEPALFVDVDNGMRIARKEIFGPVLCLIGYDDLDHAVELANDSPYGLAASVYGSDGDLAHAVANRMRSGTVHVNTNGAAYDLPFGGFRRSGVGRECGIEGIRTYLETVQVVG